MSSNLNDMKEQPMQMSRRSTLTTRGGVGVLLCALSLGLVGCGDDSGDDTGDSTDDSNDDSSTSSITIATVATDSGSQAFLAQDLGIFAEHDLDVEVTIVPGVPELAAAITSGEADIALTSPLSVMTGITQGRDFTLVAPGAAYRSDPDWATTVLMVKTDSDIEAISDLEGTSIAVNALTSLPYYALAKALDDAGVDIEGVELVQLPFPQVPGAVEEGRADAGAVVVPFSQVAETDGTLRTLFDLYEVISDGEPYLTTAWFSTSEFVESEPEASRRFAEAIVEASTWGNEPANREQRKEILGEYTEMEGDILDEILLLPFGTSIQEQSALMPLIDVINTYGEMNETVEWEDLVWEDAP